MIGDYIGPRLALYTEKIIGTTSTCLGLIFRNNYFIPNTILHEDIRNITQSPIGKIIAIFKMKNSERNYTQLIYKKKDITLTQTLLPSIVLDKITPQFWNTL